MQTVVTRARIAVAVFVTLTSVLVLLQPNISVANVNASARINSTGSIKTQGNALPTSSLEEPFDFLNLTVWKISNYTVSYGRFDPTNVAVSKGMLQLSVPAELNEGGQIQTVNRFLHNRFGTRMKTSGVANTCTSLFTYYQETGVTGSDQIAIEIYGSNPSQMYFTTWKLGKADNDFQRVIINVGFDSSLAFHDYEFALFPEHVDVFVDGTKKASLTDINYIPTQAQKLLLTCWNANWMGLAPTTAVASFDSAWIRPLI
jgi:beta-glucanase (GH16 family)